MPLTSRSVRSSAFVALACAALALSACSSGAAPEEPAPNPSASADESAPSSSAGESQGASAGSDFTVADVLSRYPSCEAIGGLLDSAIDGLDLVVDEVGSEAVSCSWSSSAGEEASAVSVAIDPNLGADDVPTQEAIAVIGLEYVPDAAVESVGGRVVVMKNSADLISVNTAVHVPGVYVSVTPVTLGKEPALAGPAAIDVAKQLLDIRG